MHVFAVRTVVALAAGAASLALFLFTGGWHTAITPVAAGDRQTPPDRLLLLVFDQMRPDYIDRFKLENFRTLRASSRNYPEAYVGHLGSQTVVSHLVIPTGLLPKALPWQDNVMVDWAGRLGKPGANYDTGRLTRDQSVTLLAPIPESIYLPWRLRAKYGKKVVAIGEKDYSTLQLGTPTADAIITLAKAAGRCHPAGFNVPGYISSNPRFTLECSDAYTTGLPTLYSLDGNHYVPGTDQARLGGDIWTTDVALQVMEREDWSGLLLTFGGIDKIGHMLGEQDGDGLRSVTSPYHLQDVLRVADAQLGRLLNALRARDLLDRTLIVVTSDHGAQKNDFYLGNNKYQSCCGFENNDVPAEPPYWIDHLKRIGKVQSTYQDTSVKVWLADRSIENERSVALGLEDISGMTEVYALRGSAPSWRYERIFSRVDRQPAAFQRWARRHHAELVDTMASAGAPHLVGLLADGYGFGRIGDHGGAQERVQRIPMLIRVPGEAGSTRRDALRLVDISREVTRLMELRKPGAR